MTTSVYITDTIPGAPIKGFDERKSAKAPATRGDSDLTAAVMREAWFCYRRQVGEGFPFSRKLFAAHLRSAWSVVRIAAQGNVFLEPDPYWV